MSNGITILSKTVMTNHEVYTVLSKRDQFEGTHPMTEVESETLKYLKTSLPEGKGLSTQEQATLMEELSRFDLNSLEKLQFINLIPNALVDIYAIVNDCENRFSKEDAEEIVSILQKYRVDTVANEE